MFLAAFVFDVTTEVVNMRNRTQYLTMLQFDLCGVQGDKLDHYRKGAVPEQQMFPISYVKGCKNIHQYTPGTGELVLVVKKTRVDVSASQCMIHFENLPRLAHSNTYYDFVFPSVMLCAFFVAETIGEVQDFILVLL